MEEFASLVVRVIGCLVHGSPNSAYISLVTHYTKETNTNIDMIRRVFDFERQSRGGQLPPHLLLQLDNTSQENKNQMLFTFLSFSCRVWSVSDYHCQLPSGWPYTRNTLLSLSL